MKTIFITYNPKSEAERTLATRLHTIGVASGFKMYLPDRFNSEAILSEETKIRISQSNYVVLFSISPLSSVVKQEIDYAFNYLNDKSKIIVIYDKHKGKNLKGDITNHFTAFYHDDQTQDALLKELLETITHKEQVEASKKQSERIQELQKDIDKRKKENAALLGLLGVGLGLLILSGGTSNK
ncbi:MAG TPA: hypothetical protein VK806_09800 [Bacteroidia bacterium]|jgi:hypothetical protein|nr:hypothetical protein [Bacteroidia bacterium]